MASNMDTVGTFEMAKVLGEVGLITLIMICKCIFHCSRAQCVFNNWVAIFNQTPHSW